MTEEGRQRGGTGRLQVLSRRWLHAYEEDTATEMVFRPATYKFPPSRGRRGFELKVDGRMVDIGIGPVDRPQETPGTWRLEADDVLLMFLGGTGQPSRVLKVLSVDRNHLIVQKPG
jgi:hypothetical protein